MSIGGKKNKKSIVTNLAWRFAERCGAQGVTFIVSIVLARMLEPAHYGIIALVNVFTTILQVFVDSGLGNALIQKKDADELDFSTVFYFNIFFCVLLYCGMFFFAPYIAVFYSNKALTPVIRVLSLTIIISGVKNVQQAFVSRNLVFKKFFFATLGGTLIAALIGIIMAYKGFGVWALVAQHIINMLIDTIILWVTVKWRPIKGFSLARLKVLFTYGWKLLLSSLINTIYKDVRQLIIGKMYSSSDLAFYNKGKQFPNLFVNNINISINSVLFPVMSRRQNDKAQVKQMVRKSIKSGAYLLWPCMFGLMAIGRSLIEILFTSKWLPCLPFLYIFCFVNGMEPIHTANMNAIKAMGRSDIFLKMEITKKVLGIIIILVTMRYGVLIIGVGSIVYTIIASVINAFPNKALLEYSYFEQIRDIMPAFSLSLFMGSIIYSLNFLNINNVFLLFLQVVLGVFLYILGSWLFKMESFYFVIDVLKLFLKRNE